MLDGGGKLELLQKHFLNWAITCKNSGGNWVRTRDDNIYYCTFVRNYTVLYYNNKLTFEYNGNSEKKLNSRTVDKRRKRRAQESGVMQNVPKNLIPLYPSKKWGQRDVGREYRWKCEAEDQEKAQKEKMKAKVEKTKEPTLKTKKQQLPWGLVPKAKPEMKSRQIVVTKPKHQVIKNNNLKSSG